MTHLAAALVVAAGILCLPLADAAWVAQGAPAQKSSTKAAPPKGERTGAAAITRGEQAIVVLVNDDPITAYQIEQRAAFIALSSGGGGGGDLKAKAEARWAQIVKDPKTNERFQDLMRQKNVRTREEAQALQKQFLSDLQRNMIEQLKREGRASSLPRFRKDAQEQLIEERLQIQEAKKLGIEVTDDDVKRMLKGVAERNKMNYEQFAQHLRGMGVDIATMGERFRAQRAWRDLVGRRYGAQVTVTQMDIDRVLSSAATEAGDDTLELQVGKSRSACLAKPISLFSQSISQTQRRCGASLVVVARWATSPRVSPAPSSTKCVSSNQAACPNRPDPCFSAPRTGTCCRLPRPARASSSMRCAAVAESLLTKRSAPRRRRTCNTSSSRAWRSGTCATSGRTRTSSTDERCDRQSSCSFAG
ncbi:MAG: hypothetical protein HC869_19075 [Rhodospirillales bacterium]|nr:hypothetical protein [Rhodospirillales bacterium]